MLFNSFREAVSQMRVNKYVTLSAIGIISIILLVFGFFLLSLHNLNIFAEVLRSEMEIVAFASDNASPETIREIRAEIEAMKEVENVTFISKDDAMEIFSRDLSGFRGVIEGLRENPLPDAFRIRLVAESGNPDDVRNLAERLAKINGIDDVEYGKELVERLDALISAFKVLSVIAGGIMLFIVLFIVSNTIKLTFMMRRDEIEIMRLAGATRMFIKIPYMLEGGILGLISAACAVIMLLITYRLILYKIPSTVYLWLGGIEISFITWEGIIAIILTGIVAGCFGSWTSVGRLLGIAIFFILCLNISHITVAEGKENITVEKEIEQSQKRLYDVDKQIKEKKKETKKAEEEEKMVIKKLEIKKKDLGSRKQELTKVSKDISQKKKEIKMTQANVESLTSDLAEKKTELTGLINEVYKSYMGRHRGAAEILLSSADYNDYNIRLKYQDRLIGKADSMMHDLSSDIGELNNQLLSLNRRHQTLLAKKGDISDDAVMIEHDIRENRQQLAGIQKKKAEYEAEIKRLTSVSAALKKLIASYEKERGRKASSAGGGFGKDKGQLSWPLDGDVVSSFGRQKHQEFDAYVFKKGIEIVAKGTKDIKAAYDGIVAYADWLQGYGLMLIIDHGNSYYSIYGHASKIAVSKGAKVKRGQVIATAGRGNNTDREGIYFEFRHNGEAVDPLIWFRKG